MITTNFKFYLQKQYIFIYKALMEVAQYGDTEILTSELKTAIEKLKQIDKDQLHSKMEEQFEVISFTLYFMLQYINLIIFI